MAKDNETVEVIQAPPVPGQQSQTASLLDHPLVREFGIPLAKAALKKELGIGVADKEVAKKPFGRAMYALRDVWQGIWWTIPALVFSLGLVVVCLRWFSKWLGV